MAYQDPHRGVATHVNLMPEVKFMASQLQRLIDSVKDQYTTAAGGKNKTMKIAKEWYGQLLLEEGKSSGFVHFTVTNKTLFDKKKDVDDLSIEADEIGYSLHIKQNTSGFLSNNFISASIYFNSRRGDFELRKVDFQLYGGADIEGALLFKDVIRKVRSQVESFNATNETLSGRSELSLIPLTLTSNGN